MLSLGHKPRWLDDMFATLSPHWKTDSDYYRLLCEQVVMIATAGNAVFVGLGAAIITQSMGNCFHFRLIAEQEFRVRSIARRMQISEAGSGDSRDGQGEGAGQGYPQAPGRRRARSSLLPCDLQQRQGQEGADCRNHRRSGLQKIRGVTPWHDKSMTRESGNRHRARDVRRGIEQPETQRGNPRPPPLHPGALFPHLATRNDWYMAVAHAVRDRMLDDWVKTLESSARQERQDRELPVGRVPDGPPSGEQPGEPGDHGAGPARRRPNSARIWTTCCARRKSRASATAASAGSPPVTWTPWPPCESRPSATASATSSASSTRRSATAGRWRRPTNGCAWETPGRSAARKSPTR